MGYDVSTLCSVYVCSVGAHQTVLGGDGGGPHLVEASRQSFDDIGVCGGELLVLS